MKAMVCPQCGALIDKISLRDKFAFCDYCAAKILLPENKEKIGETSRDESELTPYQKYLKTKEENARKYEVMSPPDYEPVEDKLHVPILIGVLSIVLLPILILFVNSGSCRENSSELSNKNFAATNTTTSTPTSFTTTEPNFYPRVNYTVSVKWTGANDMEHFEMPNIDTTKLPTSDVKQLKKTVFANRSAQVKVTIDENGEVTEAKAISGHSILKEAAENAARKTLFSNRSKPTKRVLTYIFRLTED